jgi:hypothetical protein
MRKPFTLSLIAFVLTSYTSLAQFTYEDFDNDAAITYGHMDGNLDQMHSNPATAGDNTSALCGKYIRNGGVQYDVILMEPAGGNNIGDVSDYLSGTKTMSIKVYSPGPGLTVQITLEDPIAAQPANYPIGRHSVYLGTTTKTNEWETISFAFDNRPDGGVSNTVVNRMIVLFEPGNWTSTEWLFDDVMGPELDDPCGGIAADAAIGEDYDCQRNFNFTFANGNHIQNEMNPANTGANTSEKCGKFMKWLPPTSDGAFGGDLKNSFKTSAYNQAHIDLYCPTGGQSFVVIFQDGNGQNLLEKNINTTSTGDWVTHDIDLSGISLDATIEKTVFLLNPGTVLEDSIYLDNFKFSYGTLSSSQETTANETSIFPMPSRDQITVSHNVMVKDALIYDLTGKMLHQKENINSSNFTISTAHLLDGVYVLVLRDVGGTTHTHQIVK